eukprot:12997336-Alexandrium_andersonii.AAC.1
MPKRGDERSRREESDRPQAPFGGPGARVDPPPTTSAPFVHPCYSLSIAVSSRSLAVLIFASVAEQTRSNIC